MRKAANRAKCQNHLKQIGLATLNYESARQALPPSRLPNEGPSWAWLILPYLEQDNLYKMWNTATQGVSQVDQTALKIPIAVYFCPSRRPPGGLTKPFLQAKM